MSENLIKGVKVNGTPYKIDYNSMANLPFGIPGREILLPLQENVPFEISSSDNAKIEVFSENVIGYGPIIAGDTYIITIDGIEYECQPQNNDPFGYDFSQEDIFLIHAENHPNHPGKYFWNIILPNTGTLEHSFKIEHIITSKISLELFDDLFIGACGGQRVTLKQHLAEMAQFDEELISFSPRTTENLITTILTSSSSDNGGIIK